MLSIIDNYNNMNTLSYNGFKLDLRQTIDCNIQAN